MVSEQEIINKLEVKILNVDDNTNVNAAILERLEKVVLSLQENSVKMGQLLAVHDEKLTKQDRIDAVLFEKIEQVQENLDRHAETIKKGCERDIRLVDNLSLIHI